MEHVQGVEGERAVIGVAREIMKIPIPIGKQEEAIRRYVEDKKLGGRVVFVVLPNRYEYLTLISLRSAIRRARARIVVVYSWNLLSNHCRTLAEMLSAIFDTGVQELHQAYDGSVIARDDWEKCGWLLRGLAVSPFKTNPQIIRETEEYVPLSIEEAMKIYNVIAEERGEARLRSYKRIYHAMRAIDDKEYRGKKVSDYIMGSFLEAYRKQTKRGSSG